jgi:hypothetical protein
MTFVNANDVKITFGTVTIPYIIFKEMIWLLSGSANYVKGHSHIFGLNTSANSFVNPNKQKITFGWETITNKIP